MSDNDKFVLIIAAMLLLLAILPSCTPKPLPSLDSSDLHDAHPVNMDPVVPEDVPTTYIEVEAPFNDVEPFDASEYIDPELMKPENRNDNYKGKPSYDINNPDQDVDLEPEEDEDEDDDLPPPSNYAPNPWDWIA